MYVYMYISNQAVDIFTLQNDRSGQFGLGWVGVNTVLSYLIRRDGRKENERVWGRGILAGVGR